MGTDMADDSAEILCQSFLQEAIVRSFRMSRNVHPFEVVRPALLGVWMDSDLLQIKKKKKRSFDSSGFPSGRSLTSVSAVFHCKIQAIKSLHWGGLTGKKKIKALYLKKFPEITPKKT